MIGLNALPVHNYSNHQNLILQGADLSRIPAMPFSLTQLAVDQTQQ
jgi:hypothetical protein